MGLVQIVDGRQTTPANRRKKFADQLHLTDEFDKALSHYEVLRKLHCEREMMPQTFLQGLPDVARAIVEKGVIERVRFEPMINSCNITARWSE